MTATQQLIESFFSARKFYDDEHFPYGIDRSGEFTVQQAQLLTNTGHAMRALAKGEREPITEEEQQFVTFCHGQKNAETAYEKTWERYCKLCNRDDRFFTLSSRPSANAYSDDDDFNDYDDDD